MNDHIVEGLRPLAVDIESCVQDPANAREHGEANLDAIKQSLAAYGQHRPAVAQKRPDGTLLVRIGNGMLDAAKALGWTQLAVLVVDEGDVEATARGIADNRTAELATWDRPVLAALLKSIGDAAPTGFTAEQSLLLARAFCDDDSGEVEESADEAWEGMPDFEHEDQTSCRTIIVHFKEEADVEAFAKLIGQDVGEKARSVWYPENETEKAGEQRYVEAESA